MIAVSHPTGNTFVRALLRSLKNKNLLARFFTTICAPDEKWMRLLPTSLREELSRRAFDLPRSKIATFPAREATRLLSKKMGMAALTENGVGWASVDAVYQGLDQAVASWLRNGGECRAVHCYEDGAGATFQEAARHDVRRIYELPIAYWKIVRNILNEEAARLPDWEPTLFSTRDSPQKLERKTRELELAEIIICPSRFVFDSLPEEIRNTRKCVIAPFGSPALPSFEKAEARGSKKLRILFAGAMTQRKGLADLFAAMKLLDRSDVELVVMGEPAAPMHFYRKQFPDFVYEPPRSHEAVIRLMQTCDVLALPSLVEGRALVQQEALSCGLPLIVTANAGGEDLVEEGITGFLVPIRSPEKIAEKISWFAENRESLPGMKEATRQKAAGCTWEMYSETIIRAGGFAG